MGYIFQSKEFSFIDDLQDLQREYKSYRRRLFHKHGNAEDTGELSTLPAKLDYRNVAFTSREEAEEYIKTNHERHQPAIAVELRIKAENTTYYLVGGWCNS